MGSKRRYRKIGEHPLYDDAFDTTRVNSNILNTGDRVHLHSIFPDKRNLTSLIIEFKGDENGMYFMPGEAARQAYIPATEEELAKVEKHFKIHNQMRINSGKPPVEEYPPEMAEKKYKLEALLDVYTEELELIEKKLANFTEEEQFEDDDLMLKRGPMGASRLSNGFCVSWDHQHVKPNDEGVLIIDDSRSPYHGLSSVDYYTHIVKPWNRAKLRMDTAKDKLKRQLYAKGIPETFDKELKKLRSKMFEERPEYADLFGLKLDGKPYMPVYPKGCKNHKQKNNS